jgi:hypothetical protein
MPEDQGTASPILRRYYELREYLGIDLMAIDVAYMQTPRILQDAGELAAEADRNEGAAKHTLDIVKAGAGERIRQSPVNGRPPSEERIKALLSLQEDVQAAQSALNQAHYESQVCTALFKSLDTQASRLLPKVSDMVTVGFISPTAAYEGRRREIREARVAHDLARRRHSEVTPIGRPIS